MRVQAKKLSFSPALEVVQSLEEFSNHVISMTAYFASPQINPFAVKRTTRGSFGILSHIQKTFQEPQFSDGLLFLKFPLDLTYNFAYYTLVQGTLLPGRKSIYWLNELQYSLNKDTFLLLALRVLAGEDNSYFGAWRNQSSVSFGVKQLW